MAPNTTSGTPLETKLPTNCPAGATITVALNAEGQPERPAPVYSGLPADPKALEGRILQAMRELGREPDLSRIARKADLPTVQEAGRVRLAEEAVAAMNALLKRRAILPGTRGGFRLPERC